MTVAAAQIARAQCLLALACDLRSLLRAALFLTNLRRSEIGPDFSSLFMQNGNEAAENHSQNSPARLIAQT